MSALHAAVLGLAAVVFVGIVALGLWAVFGDDGWDDDGGPWGWA